MSWPAFSAGTARLEIQPFFGDVFQTIDTRVKAHKAPAVKVPVSVNMAGFRTNLKTAVKGVNAPALKIPLEPGSVAAFRTKARSALAGMPALSTKVRLDLDTSKLQGQKAALSGGNLTAELRLDTVFAQGQLHAFRAVAGAPIRIPVELDAAGAVAHLLQLRALVAGLHGDLGGLPPIPSGTISSVGRLGSLAGVARVGLMGLAGVSLIPLVGQLVKAAGVVALLPAMGAAAAATIGTLALGTHGVKDALKAGFDQAKDSGEEAEKSAKAAVKAQRGVDDARKQAARTADQGAESIRRAEKGVQSAQADSVRAQEDLTRARKDAKEQIEDLNLALKGSAVDEESAIIAVERAAERIRNLGKDGDPVSGLDRREAKNDYDQAVQRLAEVRERNADLRQETQAATLAGVEGSEQVVAAKEKVTAAADAEVEAQRDLDRARRDAADANADAQQRILEAQEALNEALTESGTKAKEFDEAMARLSPNAQAFVNSILGMRDAWRELKFAVQDSLFADMGPTLERLATTYMPILTEGLGGLADVLNGRLRAAMDWLNGDQVQGDISAILENTTTALGPLLDGVGNLGRALLDITAVGSELLPDVTSAFEDGTGNWADMISEMRRSGDLKKFMQDAVDTFSQLWRIAKNLGGMANGLFRGSDEVGASWLDSIEEATKRWSDTWGTPEGQRNIRAFFKDLQEIVDAIAATIKTVAGFIPRRDTRTPEERAADDRERREEVKKNGSWWEKTVDWIGGGAWDGTGAPGDSTKNDPAPEGRISRSGTFEGPEVSAKDGFTPAGVSVFQGDASGIDTTGWQEARTEGSSLIGDPDAWREKWEDLTGSIGDGWNNTIRPAWDGFTGRIGDIGSGFATNVGNIASGAWSGLTSGVSDGWNNTIAPAWNTLRTEGLGGLADDFTSYITDGAVTSWTDLPGKIGEGVGNIITTHFPGLSGGLDTLRTKFNEGTAKIGEIWNSLKGKLAGPINWVIDTVYNDGIVRFWNAIGPKIGLPELTTIGGINVPSDTPAFAKGGTVGVMSGYSPGVDDRLIAVGGGEAVMRPEWTRAVGPDFVDKANEAARSGGVDGARKFMGGFANGGIVESIVSIVEDKFPGMSITSTFRDTNDLHGQGKAVDISNGGDAGTPEMDEAARFFYENYGSNLAELIHWPLNGWQNIDEGQPFNFGEPTNSEHRNHVHIASHNPLKELSEDEKKGLLARLGSMVSGAAKAVTNKFRNLAADLFEKPLNALGSTIPNPFPGLGDFGRVPKAAFDTIAKAAIAKVRGSAAAKDGSSGSSGAALGEWGGSQEDYAREIVAAAKDRGLPPDAAAIGVATALVESGMRMYANNSVPESLDFPHDAIGSDFDSVGLFQQRNNGAWGTVEQRMNPRASAGMFFDQLMTKDWQSMDRGAAAQAVQVSAFPGKYAERMAEADEIVNRLYGDPLDRDTGGNVPPGDHIVRNRTGKDEYMLNPEGFEVLKQLIDMGENLLPALATMLGQPAVAPAGQVVLNGARKAVDEAQLASTPGHLTEADMLANMAPEARQTFQEYATVPEGGTPEQRMAQWADTYSQKWANWGRETAGELIDDALSPLGLGVSVGTIVTQDVPEAMTRLARLHDMAARGYTRTLR
ncbi:hypothetical protein GCM10023094_09300 [Rhodococcus olei]|uniref:Tape measure protein n=1 Tax=Rhodococcus olei TaxID=2161675 RepID=A0ABP8NUR0_9NOCA